MWVIIPVGLRSSSSQSSPVRNSEHGCFLTGHRQGEMNFVERHDPAATVQ